METTDGQETTVQVDPETTDDHKTTVPVDPETYQEIESPQETILKADTDVKPPTDITEPRLRNLYISVSIVITEMLLVLNRLHCFNLTKSFLKVDR